MGSAALVECILPPEWLGQSCTNSPLGLMGPIIVVAEDNQPFRSMLVSTLTLNGYTPIPASDGHEALLRVKESLTAALLIDVSLPGISGVRVVEVLRAQPEWADLPMIGMSGYDLPSDEAQLFTAFLQKPLSLAELLGLLEKYVPRAPDEAT